mgnify:CR=1 FL=1
MKIFITGTAGFIGFSLAKELSKKKYKIYTICISFSVIDRISYFTEYRKKIFK